ncbi:MAG: restriction endonuclease subunit S [Gammaproteobacteria bacterium]|nr:restriction endonuclease subunit S [Gammaproteobacteria bacterium]
MDAQQFLAEFGHIANARGGVEKLRLLILQFAMQGKLHDQIGPRSRYLLGDIGKWGSGGTPAKTHGDYYGGDIPWLVIGDLNDGLVNSASVSITQKGLENSSAKLVPPGTLFIGMYGSIGKLGIAGMACATNQAIAHCIPDEAIVLTPYLFIFIRANREHLFSQGKGLAQQNISQTILKAQSIDLPSVKEQEHIVAKVDELMALCDKLEAQQRSRRTLQNNLRQSTLQAVASSQSPHELQDSWKRLEANFGQLFSEPGDVRMLRDVIFDLALRGVFLPEVMGPDLADVLADGLTPLPRGWHWKTLAELSEYITSGSRGWKSYISNTGDSFIRSQDIKHDVLIFENPAFVSLPVKAEGKRTLVRQGDLLLTITGGNVGKCAMVPVLSQDAYVSQHVALIRLRETWLAEFVHAWMINTFGGRNFLARYIYGDKPGLNLAQVGSVPVPVPTPATCVAILVKLRTYQGVCEKLERQLRVKQELAESLTLAVVSSLTGIAVEQEEEPMKAPQTELVAPVRLGRLPDVKDRAPLATILARHNGEMSAKDLWQRFGGEIDAFYAQLKTEVACGWILEPTLAEMREKLTEAVGG